MLKEFLQLKRDRITFGMVVGMPIIQLILFGYAINTDPKNLPTAVVISEHSEFTRSYLEAMKTSGYFEFVAELPSEEEARARWRAATCSSSCNFPADFTRQLLRGERPAAAGSKPTPPTRPPPVRRSRRCASSSPRSVRKDLKGALCPAGRRCARRSRCACTSSTTRKGSRSTTSCRA